MARDFVEAHVAAGRNRIEPFGRRGRLVQRAALRERHGLVPSPVQDEFRYVQFRDEPRGVQFAFHQKGQRRQDAACHRVQRRERRFQNEAVRPPKGRVFPPALSSGPTFRGQRYGDRGAQGFAVEDQPLLARPAPLVHLVQHGPTIRENARNGRPAAAPPVALIVEQHVTAADVLPHQADVCEPVLDVARIPVEPDEQQVPRSGDVPPVHERTLAEPDVFVVESVGRRGDFDANPGMEEQRVLEPFDRRPEHGRRQSAPTENGVRHVLRWAENVFDLDDGTLIKPKER